MPAKQTNTQVGMIVRTANEALAEGRLVQLVDAVGQAKVRYPTADGVICQYVTAESADSGAPVSLIPLTGGRNIRITVGSGLTIAGGAAVFANASDGKIKAVAGSKFWTIGYTEEDAQGGQDALIRPTLTWKETL